LIVLLAGVTMNVILAYVLLTSISVIGAPKPYTLIDTVTDGSPAAQAGIRPGDRILAVNGKPVTYFQDFQKTVSDLTDNTPANTKIVPFSVVVQHAGEAQPVTITVQALAHPDLCAQPPQGHFGVTIGDSAYKGAPWDRPPLWQAPLLGFAGMGDVVVATGAFIGQVVHGQQSLPHCISGPVGIVRQTGQEASYTPITGPAPLLFFTALISLNLAFVNALPIPALDGGRVVFVLIEMLRRGKRISPEREGLVNLIGMGLLLLLILIVTINDIGNWVH
jgi:regulator of sigma E protease